MTQSNQIGVTSYPIAPELYVEGMILTAHRSGHPYVLPKRRQVYRIAFGGTASDGDYVTTITHPDGTEIVITTTRSTTPSSNANLATQHALDVMAVTGRKGVIKSAAVASSTNVDIAFKHAGRDYTVACTAPGSGTLGATERTDPAGETIKMGRMLTVATLDSIQAVRNLTSTDTASAVLGVAGRLHSGAVRPYSPATDDVPKYVAGDTVTLFDYCIAILRNVSGSAATAGAGIFVVIDSAGGDEVGQVRATDDGSNAVEMSASQARWLEATPAGALGPVLIKI